MKQNCFQHQIRCIWGWPMVRFKVKLLGMLKTICWFQKLAAWETQIALHFQKTVSCKKKYKRWFWLSYFSDQIVWDAQGIDERIQTIMWVDDAEILTCNYTEINLQPKCTKCSPIWLSSLVWFYYKFYLHHFKLFITVDELKSDHQQMKIGRKLYINHIKTGNLMIH